MRFPNRTGFSAKTVRRRPSQKMPIRFGTDVADTTENKSATDVADTTENKSAKETDWEGTGAVSQKILPLLGQALFG